MTRIKLTNEQVEEAKKLLEQGYTSTEIAKRFKVHRSTILHRVKYPVQSFNIPLETKNKVIKAIKEGYTKAEAAQMYGLNIGTVYCFTRGIVSGYRSQGNHCIRTNGMKLLNRLMTDGYLVSDFFVPTVRNLQRHFPVIMSARYKDKTFFYLPGREQETIEAFFREKPDRVINYRAIEEMAYLLGVQISKHDQKNLLEKYKRKHARYWESRRLIQRSIFDFVNDNDFMQPQEAEPGFRLFPKK